MREMVMEEDGDTVGGGGRLNWRLRRRKTLDQEDGESFG